MLIEMEKNYLNSFRVFMENREKKIIQRIEGDSSLSVYLEKIKELEGLKRNMQKLITTMDRYN
jgi:hypothetical protein